MFFVYVLHSVKFEKFYIGLTSNLEDRIRTHNESLVKSTKAFVPWVIIHIEEFKTRQDVRVREKYLKSAAGRSWRKIIWGCSPA